jgi:hypothetical protein
MFFISFSFGFLPGIQDWEVCRKGKDLMPNFNVAKLPILTLAPHFCQEIPQKFFIFRHFKNSIQTRTTGFSVKTFFYILATGANFDRRSKTFA